MDERHVTGLAELQSLLDTLPAKMEKNVVRGGLRAGANIIKQSAKQMAPVGEPSAHNAKFYGGYPGALRDTIRVGVRSKGGKVIAYVKAGGKSKKGANVYYAHFPEFGTVNMRASPFMRPALDAQAQNAVVAAGEYMKTRLATKEGLDTTDIVIEAEE